MATAHQRSWDFIDAVIGTSYRSLLFFWIGSMVVFAVLYTFLSYTMQHGPAPIVGPWFERLADALYFSVITATSTGYGDIVPHGFSRVLAAVQSVTSVFALGVIVAKVMSQRQGMIMEHVHALSFGVAFNDIHQGLFMARKDMDILLEKLRSGEHLVSKDWKNLLIALRQTQIFIAAIPRFYDAQRHSEIVSGGQEGVLFDAVERTLGRIGDTIVLFERANYAITRNNERCTKELQNLVQLVDRVFPQGEHYAIDPENREELNDILARTNEIRAHLATA